MRSGPRRPAPCRRLSRWALAAALSALAAPLVVTGAARVAEAGVVERVVAVVGEQAILLSDLRRRGRPLLMQIHDRVPAGAQRSAMEDDMNRELLQQMIDERLVQVAADRAQRKVAPDEIDNGLRNIAGSQGLTTDELVAAAAQSGLSAQELRDQVQRQILEQKMLSLRVVPRVRISSEDVRLGYLKLQRDERKRLGYRPQWILLLMPSGSSAEAKLERRQLADRLAASARAGADFAELARTYSDDSATRGQGGDLGPVKAGTLAQSLEDMAMSLEVGEVSVPFAYGAHLVIMRLAERDASALPALEQAHDRIASEVFAERLQKARRQWLDELKRGVYVDVRR